jgi:hypothetical protein
MPDDDAPELNTVIRAMELLAYEARPGGGTFHNETQRLCERAYIALKRMKADVDRWDVLRAIERARRQQTK